MSQAQGMVEEDQVGGVKRKSPTVAMTVPKTIPVASGRDGAKEGMLRNHCESLVEEGIANEKAGEGVFKLPKVPRKSPDKKGKATEEGVQGTGRVIRRGKRFVHSAIFLYFLK